jgi:isocitrate dehydrogenase (NAD+)
VVDSIRANGVALKGPISTPARSGHRSANIELRDLLDLHTGIRPCRALPGAPTPYPETDVVVIRMVQEDLYAGIEYERGTPETERLRDLIAETDGRRLPSDTGISIKPLSASNARRVVRRAFDYARAERREKVTAVHKATVMRHTDGLFLEVAREVAADYPDIEFADRLVDAVCHDLVSRPSSCDVLVLPMLYGDIVSDLCAAMAGGIGTVPGVNLGDSHAVFEAAHGTAPRRAGRNSANPVGMILSGAMLLRRLGERQAAERLESAVEAVVAEGRVQTTGTDELAVAVVEAL